MNPRAARWLAVAAAGAVTALAGCASLSPDKRSTTDRFADAYIELLPVAALMGHAAAKDPRWPLGEKAALVSAAQLGCMRQSLTPAEVEAVQRQTAKDYASAHADTLAADLAVLEGGAARLIGHAMRAGGGMAETAAKPTTEQARALVAFANEARYADLRQATGLTRLAGGPQSDATERGQDISRALTVKFLTDAFLRCHIPVKLLY